MIKMPLAKEMRAVDRIQTFDNRVCMAKRLCRSIGDSNFKLLLTLDDESLVNRKIACRALRADTGTAQARAT